MIKKLTSQYIIILLTLVMLISLFAALQMNGNVSATEGNIAAGETLSENAIFTQIDEDGNTIIIEEEESGIVEEPQTFSLLSRSVVSQEDILIEKGVVNFRTKDATENTTYTDAQTGLTGYTNGCYAADAAYLGHNSDRTKVKFMLAGVIGWVDASEVQVLDFSSSSVQTLSKYYAKNNRLYHGIVTNLNNTSYTSSIDVGPKPTYLENGKEYYSYDGHYFYDYNSTQGYMTMLSDYRNDTRENSVNPSNPYYNYYQYLPQRSTTIYTADEINTVIEKKAKSTSVMLGLGDSFIENQNKYGINALLTVGIAANESAWGSSTIATTKNNLFGHHAYDSDPNGSSTSYSTPAFSIYYHMSTFMSKRYCYPNYWTYHGGYVGDKASGINVKYASDPYWGEKAAAYAWIVDKELGSKDSFRYTLAIKDVHNYDYHSENIKASASSSSKTLYKTTNKAGDILTSYAVILLNSKTTNGYYKIQSDTVINSDRTAIVEDPEEYDFDSNYAYISDDYIMIVNKGTGVTSTSHQDVIDYLGLTLDSSYLYGFKLGTNMSTIISKINSLDSSITVTVKNSSGTQITSGTVSTGMTISITTQNTTKTYTCIIRGDVNGDGKISAIDYVKVRNHLDGATSLKTVYSKAADVDNNGKISALDYVKIRNHLDGKSTISQ